MGARFDAKATETIYLAGTNTRTVKAIKYNEDVMIHCEPGDGKKFPDTYVIDVFAENANMRIPADPSDKDNTGYFKFRAYEKITEADAVAKKLVELFEKYEIDHGKFKLRVADNSVLMGEVMELYRPPVERKKHVHNNAIPASRQYPVGGRK